MQATLTSLERRLSRLESDQQQDDTTDEKKNLPWYVKYSLTFTEEEMEREADWLYPKLFEDMIDAGTPGYPNPHPGGIFRVDPDFESLWKKWTARQDFVSHEVSMYRLKSDGTLCPLNFWTIRSNDPELERLRQEVVARMVAVLKEHGQDELMRVLTEWKPSCAERCGVNTQQTWELVNQRPRPSWW
jgi:hypothetical protein